MNNNTDLERLKQFHNKYHSINNIEEFIDFLETYYSISDVQLLTNEAILSKEIDSIELIENPINITGYNIYKPNTLDFKGFQFEFIVKTKSLLKNLFDNNNYTPLNKVRILDECKRILLTMSAHHNVTNSIAIVNRLDFKILTEDKGMVMIRILNTISIPEDLFIALKEDFINRCFLFQEIIYSLEEVIINIQKHMELNLPEPEQKKQNQIRFLVYEIAAGIKELGLIELSQEKKLVLEDKLFKAFGIDCGKRSKFINDINRRKSNIANTMKTIVDQLEGKVIE